MEWVETTGKTVEEAKDRALDQLGVDEQDAEFEILEEPRTGLFGRLRSEARVRARVRPTRPRPKEDRRDRRRKQRRNGGSSGDGGRSGSDRREHTDEQVRVGAQASQGAGEQPRGGRRNGGNGQRRQAEQDSEAPGRAAPDEGAAVSEGVSLAEQGEVARRFVEGLLDSMVLDASVAVEEVDEETVEVRVAGDSLGLLIGPRGATLSALQEVTRTVVQRQTVGRHGRLVVDVAGYRQKRREALERFTRQVAEEVRASGERRVLEPMNASDRKVVHDVVNTLEGVATTSEGEEPRRRVVIQPA